MASVKWQLSTRGTNPATILSTELNALANNNGALTTTAVSNSSDLDLYMDLECAVTFASSPTAGTLLEIYLVRQVDGTNYEDAAGGASPITPGNGFIGGFVLRAVTTAQRMIIPGVSVPPGDFKVLLVNKSGQAFPASGSTVKANFYREQVI
jgi:hypothetical protein